MDRNCEEANMPIGFARALSHNAEAMNNFSMMDPSAQDEILMLARNAETRDEMQKLVASIVSDPSRYTGAGGTNGYIL